MTFEDAGRVVGWLNAAFTRDALEQESFAVWVSEVAELPSFDAAMDAAKRIGRNGDRFPTLKEFRGAYRQAFDRLLAGRELEQSRPMGVVPDDVKAWLAERGLTAAQVRNGELVLGGDIPETTSMRPRPVWARALRRKRAAALGAREGWEPRLARLTDEEKHDAILVLRDFAQREGEDMFPVALVTEAQRILDEAS